MGNTRRDATYWVRFGEGDILDQQGYGTDTGRYDGLPCHNNVAHYSLLFVPVRLYKKRESDAERTYTTDVFRVNTPQKLD